MTHAGRRVLWLLSSGILAACGSSGGDLFTVPYRAQPVVVELQDSGASSGGAPSGSGGASSGGTGEALCGGSSCPRVGLLAGCCLSTGDCGVDFGIGVCLPVPTLPGSGGFTGTGGHEDGGSFGAGGSRGVGGTDARAFVSDGSVDRDAALDATPDPADARDASVTAPDGAL